METIYIEQNNVETGAGHSSKGNQLKWKIGESWYKADAFGYEGLAESIVSDILCKSNVTGFVKYEPVQIVYREKEYSGCKSQNFLSADQELIPLERLHRLYTGFGLASELARFSEVKDRISYTAEMVFNITGIEDFGKYLMTMMELDAVFLNEDRHTNNIALLYANDTKKYQLCPYFDMGLSLFSDIKEDFPLEKNLEDCRKIIRAKPFSTDFDEQLDAANELYGCHLKISLKKSEIDPLINQYKGIYSDEILERVKQILRMQMAKYAYIF